jgi:signal transduction histidine kinase
MFRGVGFVHGRSSLCALLFAVVLKAAAAEVLFERFDAAPAGHPLAIGMRSSQPVSAGDAVVPPYWRTRSFLVLLILNAAGIGGLVYYRRHRALRTKQLMLEAFSQRLLDSQEKERKRIASELHDSLGQELLVIKSQAALGLREAAENSPAKHRLAAISAAAGEAIEEVRSIAYALRPYQLDRLGFTRAVDAMIRQVASPSGIRFTTRLEPIDGVFSRDAEVSLYRIVQESVSNIVRHSRATDATVELLRRPEWIELNISDNGTGFVVEADMTGLGVIGIMERARLLGGTAHIDSLPSAGTRITVRIRCHGEKPDGRDHDSGRRRPSDLSKRVGAGGSL